MRNDNRPPVLRQYQPTPVVMLLSRRMPVSVVLNADPQRGVSQIQASQSLSTNNDPRIDLRFWQTVTEDYPTKP